MKEFRLSALVVCLSLLSTVAFAQQNPLTSPPPIPQDAAELAPIKPPHKELEKYINLNLVLIAEHGKLTAEQKEKYIAEKERIEKELTDEERGIASETVSFRLREFREKNKPKEMSPIMKQAFEDERKALEIRMKQELETAPDDQKPHIESAYKKRIQYLEERFK